MMGNKKRRTFADTLPTRAEAERLAFLAEECGEVVQAVTKVLRHGFESYNPHDMGQGSNRFQLASEVGDLLHVLEVVCAADLSGGDIPDGHVEACKREKADRLRAYSHFQKQARR